MSKISSLSHCRIFSIAICLIFAESANSQVTITGGPTCAIANTQYTYGAGNYTNYQWGISGGIIVGQSNQPMVNVKWTTSGTLSVTCSGGSGNLSVSTTTAVTGGVITPLTQHINYNTVPANLNCTASTGGNCGTPSYTYQWQSSTNDVSFSNISGGTSQNLTLSGNLTLTTYYRRFATETHTNNTAYSDTASIIVYPQLVGGSVGSNQTINYNTQPSTLTLSGVSGGTNSYTYVWYFSTDGNTWYPLLASTSTTFAPPALTQTTFYRVAVTSNGVVANSNYATVTVNPAVFGGTITPSYLAVVANSSPIPINNATLPSGGNCGSYSYQWQSSTDGINFSSISGATSMSYAPSSNFTSGIWYRRQCTCGTEIGYSNISQIVVNPATTDMNFVRTRTILKAGVTDSATAAGLTSPYDVAQVTQYFDGLGRTVQTVSMQESPLQKDLVALNVYDNYEREATKYLPYVASTSDGNFKPTAIADNYNFNSALFPGEQYYYSETRFEASPLDRPLGTYSQGLNWQGSVRGVLSQSSVNQISDSVRIWTIAYPIGSIPTTSSTYLAGTLQKTITTDEAGHQIVEYKDIAGQT